MVLDQDLSSLRTSAQIPWVASRTGWVWAGMESEKSEAKLKHGLRFGILSTSSLARHSPWRWGLGSSSCLAHLQ